MRFASGPGGQVRAKCLVGKTLRSASQRAACPAPPNILKSCWLQAMSLKCFLSLPTGAGLLANLIPRYPEYTCIKKGGTCNYSPCPRGTKVDGRCYRNKAKCCV